MLLSELIQEDLIQLGMEAADKWEAIEVLVDRLIAAHEIRLTDRGEVRPRSPPGSAPCPRAWSRVWRCPTGRWTA